MMSANDYEHDVYEAKVKAAELFKLAVEPHSKLLYNYIRRRVRERDAEDVLQETLLAAWKQAEKDCGIPEKTLPWLIGIARHKIADSFRSGPEHADFDDVADMHGDVEPGFEQVELKEDLRAALSKLSDTDRELVYLIYTAELSYAEISDIMRIPTGTIKSRVYTIKEKLRKYLEGR